jgi:hypothetical protein
MNEFYLNLVDEINKLRSNPPAYGDKLLSFKSCFKDLVVKFPGQKVGMQTSEGFAAYEEAAKYLKTLKPISDIIASKGLCRIAKDYLDKMRECSPEEVESIEIDSIIKKYGKFKGTFNNAMDFGSDTPELVVVNLVVSDGDETRANRDLLLNPENHKIGIATGTHAEYGNLTIILSCTDFKNIVDPDDNEDFGGLAKPKAQKLPDPEPPAKTTIPPSNEKVTNATKATSETNDSDIIRTDRRERIVMERGKRKLKVINIKEYKNGKIKREVKYLLL